jgi:hypothetical protein
MRILKWLSIVTSVIAILILVLKIYFAFAIPVGELVFSDSVSLTELVIFIYLTAYLILLIFKSIETHNYMRVLSVVSIVLFFYIGITSLPFVLRKFTSTNNVINIDCNPPQNPPANWEVPYECLTK